MEYELYQTFRVQQSWKFRLRHNNRIILKLNYIIDVEGNKYMSKTIFSKFTLTTTQWLSHKSFCWIPILNLCTPFKVYIYANEMVDFCVIIQNTTPTHQPWGYSTQDNFTHTFTVTFQCVIYHTFIWIIISMFLKRNNKTAIYILLFIIVPSHHSFNQIYLNVEVFSLIQSATYCQPYFIVAQEIVEAMLWIHFLLKGEEFQCAMLK